MTTATQHKAMDDPLNANDLNGDDMVIQGFRRTRERTNWLCRGTAMTASDQMDTETLQTQALDFQTALGCIASVFAGLIALAQSRIRQNLPCNHIQSVIRHLEASIAWIACYVEMIYLDIEDRLYCVHRRRRFTNLQFRIINQLSDDNESECLFGFKMHEL